ncbi:PqqD family protein [Paenibacillus harenae]|uniref:PqqD family protein n=1 Tax=Paenibacillus harenae TaxID=306543 RepID=UPI000427AD2D|nr:PqqD family protein [Paenibacillus harenae]
MTLYIRNPSCEAIELDGETMILNPDGLTITQLSPVASYCWSLLSETHSAGSLSSAVRSHYEETDLAVEQDISLFLRELMECGLIAAAE